MNLLYPFASLGVINGIIVALFLLFKARKGPSDIYFAGLILAFCIRIGKSVILYYAESPDPLILQIGLSACIFIGPFFFLYLKSLAHHTKSISKGDLFLVVALLLLILIVGLVFPYRKFPSYWNPEIVQGIYTIWALFILLGIRQAYQLLGFSFFTPWKLKGDQRYLSGIIISVVLITLTYQSALFFARFTYIWGAFIFSSSFYLLGFRAMKQKSIAAKPAPKEIAGADKLMAALNTLMESEQPYKKPTLKLDDLASQLQVSRHTLSQLLNQSTVSGYANYVRRYRIDEAKKLIRTRPDLSLEGIGYEAGFKSKSVFFESFKKLVGSTPASYKKDIEARKA